MTARRTLSLDAFRAELAAQGVQQNDFAVVCPVCGTVQSMNSLLRAGAERDAVDRLFGFSCEGRLTNAGQWPANSDQSATAAERRNTRGCNWTLGGLFRIHQLVVIDEDGAEHPLFEIATPRQALALATLLWTTRDEAVAS